MDWGKIGIDAILTDKDENGNRYLSQFFRDYMRHFPNTHPNWGCQKCFDEYFRKLIKIKETMKNKVKSKTAFVLKKKYTNMTLEFGSAFQVNNQNLTDEIALKLLGRKNGERYFSTIPAEIPELEEVDAKDEMEDIDLTQSKEIKDDFEEVNAEVKSDEARVDDYVRKNKRKELEELAADRGLSVASFPDKYSIAWAIVEAENDADLIGSNE